MIWTYAKSNVDSRSQAASKVNSGAPAGTSTSCTITEFLLSASVEYSAGSPGCPGGSGSIAQSIGSGGNAFTPSNEIRSIWDAERYEPSPSRNRT